LPAPRNSESSGPEISPFAKAALAAIIAIGEAVQDIVRICFTDSVPVIAFGFDRAL
jgi:hypothetical protein